MSEPRYVPIVGAFEARYRAQPDKGESCYFWLNGDRYIRSPRPSQRAPRLSIRQEPRGDIEPEAKYASINYAYRRGMQHAFFDTQLAYPVGDVSPVPAPIMVARMKPEHITPGDVVTWPSRHTGYAGGPAKQYLVIGSTIGRAVTKFAGRSTPEGVQLTDGRETWTVRDTRVLVKCGRLA